MDRPTSSTMNLTLLLLLLLLFLLEACLERKMLEMEEGRMEADTTAVW